MGANTSDIIRGQHNKEYMVDLKEILTWYPGDYVHQCGSCDDALYHTCISIDLQWQYVLHNIIYPDEQRYSQVYQSVLEHGFIAPLRARITENDHVVLLDGHNRVGVALDMLLREAPVYIGSVDKTPDDLVAPDSGWWYKGHPPWSTILGR